MKLTCDGDVCNRQEEDHGLHVGRAVERGGGEGEREAEQVDGDQQAGAVVHALAHHQSKQTGR